MMVAVERRVIRTILVLASFASMATVNGFAFTRIPSISSIRNDVGSISSTSFNSIRKSTTTVQNAKAYDKDEPQVISSGYSDNMDLNIAINEAVSSALKGLPIQSGNTNIELVTVSVSSVYDSQSSPAIVIPSILEASEVYSNAKQISINIQNIVGSYTGGNIGCVSNVEQEINSNENNGNANTSILTMESEGEPGIVITMFILPDVNVHTFHLEGDDVPDDIGRLPKDMWKNFVGLAKFQERSIPIPHRNKSSDTNTMVDTDTDTDMPASSGDDDTYTPPPIFMLLPSPSFQNSLDDFLRGLTLTYGPEAAVFGGIASTVSSLSRARLFRYTADDPNSQHTLADGCLGVAFSGDIQAKSIIAQGSKPVGGIYRIVSGEQSTIGAIQLDELATQQLKDSQTISDDDDMNDNYDTEDDGIVDIEGVMTAEEIRKAKKKAAAAAFAKAVIPKPVLAEANYIMQTLSDDDQSFMRKALLLGLERSTGNIAKSPDELLRLAKGEGHRFTVHQVASAGMKDGSVTLPLGSVNIQPGTRLRFYVRDSSFAKKEVNALWIGYKKKLLQESFNSDKISFNPTGCILLPTLDRGSKFFGGKPGFESSSITDFLPSIPSISGFFTNGFIGKLEENDQVMIHGSASGYTLLGSITNRPVHDPRQYTNAEENLKKQDEPNEDNYPDNIQTKQFLQNVIMAPKDENGELILRRREVHSGRSLTVSSVEWSVVEKAASPTSVLEGFMWDKETEVDRLRERVPLSNLLSQCKLYSLDPSKPKPRDWVGPVSRASQMASNNFVFIPELKRMEPNTGSLRKRYNIAKITEQLVIGHAPALSVNCDSILFGGKTDDITIVRETSSKAILNVNSSLEEGVIVPPVLASDLILYPYQLYKLRLAGADAVTLVVGALTSKDLLYLTKIAASLQLQVLASVTSEVQIDKVATLQQGSISALIVSNRQLDDFSLDDTGFQALDLLNSESMKKLSEIQKDLLVLVEGGVGSIKYLNQQTGEVDTNNYIKILQESGAVGAIVARSLADRMESGEDEVLQRMQEEF